jgi:hypothetical protein
MENLLPILIGIIWVAYTLYNKGKKKNVVRQPQVEKQQDAKPLSLFERILMGEEIKQPQYFTDYPEPKEPEPIARPIKIKENLRKTPIPFLNEELAGFVQEGQSVSEFFSHDKTIEEILQERDEGFGERDFDLRKAVIYAEVLNTPYIDYK